MTLIPAPENANAKDRCISTLIQEGSENADGDRDKTLIREDPEDADGRCRPKSNTTSIGQQLLANDDAVTHITTRQISTGAFKIPIEVGEMQMADVGQR